MRVLVVEDDKQMRRLLGRLMAATFGSDVDESDTGLAALQAVERVRPDLVLTDMQMPSLGGMDLIRALRASADHRDIPVVVVSAVSSRVQIKEAIQLGIEDYLLKPVDLSAATLRMANVIKRIRTKARPPQRTATLSDRPALLIVDPDPNFRQLLAGILGGAYEVSHCASGTEALELWERTRPTIVCLGEGIGLLNERLLASLMRGGQNAPDSIFLWSKDGGSDDSLFDGVGRKTFVPEALLDRWRTLVADRGLAGIVSRIGDEILGAAQQTLGIMSQREVDRLPDAFLPAIPVEIGYTAALRDTRGSMVNVSLYTTAAEAKTIVRQMVDDMEDGEQVAGAFAALTETFAGRVLACFDAHGHPLTQDAPEAIAELPSEGRLGLVTTQGERLVAVVEAID